MQINIVYKSTAKYQILPLADNENLAETLENIAQKAGISAENLSVDFKAKAKEQANIYASDGKITLLGLGKKPKAIDFSKIFRSFFYQQKSKLPTHISIQSTNNEDQIEAIINGIYLAQYSIGVLKTDAKPEPNFFEKEVIIDCIVAENASIEKAQKAAFYGKQMAEVQCRMMALGDAPANYKYPQKIADFAIEAAEKYGFEAKIYEEKQCASLGLNALLAVGQGSSPEKQARLIVLEYKGAEENEPCIGLVGKGVTFDTGGVSIKPSSNMTYMKSDMGGAAAVLGTIELAARLQLPINLVGIIPTTENCVDGNALKPSEVIKSYSGKTIEVIDTDAEGRLVLADGLSYLKKNYEPSTIIDLATLTGNCIAALGYAAAGLLSNNDMLADELLNAGQDSGEKLWRLPLWDDYKDMMKSDIADIKNLSAAPVAGAITAAKFLEYFIDGHTQWAHLDIAGMAFTDSEFGSMKSATAYGVRLLNFWLRMKFNNV